MYLHEYLNLRGVNANALTEPETRLLGINTGKSGWVADFAHIEIPAELAELAKKQPGVSVLKAKAKAMIECVIAKHSKVEAAQPAADPFIKHEALDRCSLLASMADDYLLNHEYVQARPDLLALVTEAVDKLASAYQAIGASE